MCRVERRKARLTLGLLILLLLAAAVAAPVLDDIVGFFSDAPYVQYLPAAGDRAAAAFQAIGAAASMIRFTSGL